MICTGRPRFAARADMSLSDYLLREIERALSAPPIGALLARISDREQCELSESPAEAVRALRPSATCRD